ncbi:hypothetical protein ACSBR1_042516 [Camellia fascicularis]
MKDFHEFVESMEVTDLPMLGRKFTWCNAADGEKWSRIDRFLLSSEWLECFKFNAWGLPRVVSDHCPVLLMEYDRDWGLRPFKAGFVFFAKLKALKLILKKWNIETFGNVKYKLKEAEDELHCLDLSAESRVLNDTETAKIRFFRGEKVRPKLSGAFKNIGDESVEFSKAKIWSTVKNCEGNKASGPDGFNMSCFQKC